jgi:secreted trypsin-like serine protease
MAPHSVVALNDVAGSLVEALDADGGTCSGDSGGPQFLGAGATETPIQVSITITGDVECFATNVDYRIDTPQARAFLSQFVTLP